MRENLCIEQKDLNPHFDFWTTASFFDYIIAYCSTNYKFFCKMILTGEIPISKLSLETQNFDVSNLTQGVQILSFFTFCFRFWPILILLYILEYEFVNRPTLWEKSKKITHHCLNLVKQISIDVSFYLIKEAIIIPLCYQFY